MNNNSIAGLASQQLITSFVKHPLPKASIEENLLNWIITDFQPFDVLENPKFQKIFLDASLNFPPASARTVKRRIERKFAESRASLKTAMREDCVSLSVALDCWTSNNGRPILGIVGHYLNKQWSCEKRVLEFIELQGDFTEFTCNVSADIVAGSHTGENLSAAVLSSLEELGLEQKLLTVTADNASNNSSMMVAIERTLAEKFGKDHLFLGAGWEVRCVAHVLNLIAQEFIREIHHESISDDQATSVAWWRSEDHVDVIEKIRLLCLWVRGSPLRHQEWLELAPPKANRRSIRYDVQTRWNSTCRMLEDALALRRTVDLYVHQQQELRHLALDRPGWKHIEDIVKVLNRFKTFTDVVSQADPQLTVVIAIYYDLQDLLQEASDREEMFANISPAIQKAAKVAMEKHNKYYQIAAAHELYYVAGVLDPRVKSRFLQGELGECYPDALEKIRAFVQSRYTSTLSQTVATTEPLTGLSFAQKLALRYPSSAPSTSAISDLDRYINSEPVPDTKSGDQSDSAWICNWWAANTINYPTMAKVARDLLAIPASSVAVERLFSNARDMLGVRRSSLSADSMRWCMLLKDTGETGNEKGDMAM